MNIPKFLFALVAAFIFVFFFGWFFHDVLLKDAYAQLPSAMMRTPDEFKSRFAWLVASVQLGGARPGARVRTPRLTLKSCCRGCSRS